MRMLAKELRISLITTKRAYEDLEKDGFLETVPGKGCFVSEKNMEFLREEQLRQVEARLQEAVNAAIPCGLGLESSKKCWRPFGRDSPLQSSRPHAGRRPAERMNLYGYHSQLTKRDPQLFRVYPGACGFTGARRGHSGPHRGKRGGQDHHPAADSGRPAPGWREGDGVWPGPGPGSPAYPGGRGRSIRRVLFPRVHDPP